MLDLVQFSSLNLVLSALALLFSMAVGALVFLQDRGGSRCRFALGVSAFAFPVALFVYAVYDIGVNVPYWDDYDVFLSYLSSPAPERFRSIFKFHNEHRIMVTRLVAEVLTLLKGHFDFKLCMYVGNAMLLAFLYLLWRRFKQTGTSAAAFFIPGLWMFLDLLNHQNMFWALTSVQSNSVILFAFAALLCLDHQANMRWFLMALVCAFLCTFSSGGGVAIWPCMAAMMIKQWTDRRQEKLPSENRDVNERDFHRESAKVMLFLLAATASLGFYFHGFGQCANASAVETVLKDPISVFVFFTVFCGGAAPFYPLALIVGLLIGALVLFLCSRFLRIRNNPMFFFLLFLLFAAASAAVFRSKFGIESALSYRYRVVAVSIFSSALLLALDNIKIPLRVQKWLCALMTTGAVLFNLLIAIYSWNLQIERSGKLVNNILLWPQTQEGLRYPSPEKASGILKRSVEAGVYTPDILLEKNAIAPSRLMPW